VIVQKYLAAAGRAALACACLLGWVSGPAAAEAWPTRPVTVVVPLGAGSGTDVVTRIVMEQVGEQLGRPVVVENHPGAGGIIGANTVAKAAPDGYTLLAYGGLSVSYALYEKIPYDTLHDFVPVLPLGEQPLVLVTSPSKPYKTLGDLVATAKANPGKLNYASAGIGSVSHFAAARLLAATGAVAQNIPFKGAAEAVTDVIAGRSDFTIEPITAVLSLVNEGQLLALAVSTRSRSALLPNVPTTIEAGLPANSVYPFWSGLFAPAKTPRDIVEMIYRETVKAEEVPEVKAHMAKLGIEPMRMTQEEFDTFFKDDLAANVALVKAANIPKQ
jgi:tripartite-type tricarboxylate transporter receptor subunit TctC